MSQSYDLQSAAAKAELENLGQGSPTIEVCRS